MLDLLLVWSALLVALTAFAIGRRGNGGALALAYFLGLSLIHVPGVLPFLDLGTSRGDGEETRLGFEMTIIGMAAFVVGAILARRTAKLGTSSRAEAPRRRARVFEYLAWRIFAVGIAAYFILLPLSSLVPSATSVVSAFATLLIIGLWLVLYGAAKAADQRRTLATLAILPLLPLATLVTGGFLGYGIYWMLSVITFLFVIARQRIWFYLVAVPAVFLGLSLFVTYMGQRGGIRELVWYEQASLFDRLDRVSAIVTDFQLLDLESAKHVAALDDRLNQNILVGVAVGRIESGWAEFAYGATVPLWALIPRAVWPDKPTVGGGGEVVSDFTGIRFAGGTSVGAGQVLEFYINFGVWGLVFGFLGLGFVLMRLDQGIMRALAADDTGGLLLRAMPGLTLLTPGGNLLEVLVAFVAAFVGAHLILWLNLFEVRTAARRRAAGSVRAAHGPEIAARR
jgi:hypothetical protein